MKLAKFKKKILEALDWAEISGVSVADGTWGITWSPKVNRFVLRGSMEPSCCPIGALCLKEQPPKGNMWDGDWLSCTQAGRLLDIEEGKVDAFVGGVDGDCNANGIKYRRWHIFGREVRNRIRDEG